MTKLDSERLKEKLVDIVGDPKVVFREEHLLEFSRANIGSGEKPMFIVKPQTVKEIEGLIGLAKDFRDLRSTL